MKLGTKISLGFGLVLVIALALGGMALYNMYDVSSHSDMLVHEYAPEVKVANEVERYSLLTMFANRGYSYTEEEQFLQTGKESLAKVDKALEDAAALAERAEHLVKLQEQVGTAKAAVAEYKSLMDQTVAKNQRLAELRALMDKAATEYMQNCNDFLAGQNEKMKQEIVSMAGEAVLKERLAKITIVNDIIDLGNATRVGNFKSQATRSPETMREAFKNFPKMDEKFKALRAITHLDADIARIDSTETAAKNYKEDMELFLKTWLEREELNKVRGVAAEKVLEAAQTTAIAGVDHTLEIAEEASSALSTASTVMMVGLVIALIVGLGLAYFITRSITKPINRVIEALGAGAHQVGAASGQVSSASQSLAEGASENAAALEETSSSLEEMASMTKTNADNAAQANSLMDETRNTVSKATDQMKQMTTSMEEISASGQEIGKIIKTIDEIAFQTNLLALNAAVEAARAGEAGQGFAVVADEVRNLAQRAAEAAKNTSELIEGTIQKIDQGNSLVKATDEAFHEVAMNAGKVGELVGEIAAASQEQAQGITQVNQAMSQMDQVTQQNAANAEESASAAEELNAQAESMQDVVGNLMAIVGGNGNGNGNGTYKKAGTVPKLAHDESTHHKSISPRALAMREKKKSAEVHDEQVIPMDEDFSDF